MAVSGLKARTLGMQKDDEWTAPENSRHGVYMLGTPRSAPSSTSLVLNFVQRACSRHILRSVAFNDVMAAVPSDVYHSKGVVHVLAHHKSLPAYAMTFDRHIVPWLPTISLGKQQQTRPVLKRDLADARKEYREKIQILVLSPQEHKQRMHALFSVRTTFGYLTCWDLILCTEVPRPLRRDEGLDRSTCTFLPR